MTPEFVINLARKAIETTLLMASPMLLAGLIIGLMVSIFQAVTQDISCDAEVFLKLLEPTQAEKRVTDDQHVPVFSDHGQGLC